MIRRACRRYVLHLILVFIVVDHWLSLIMKRLQANLDRLGVVVIGRNEGERLRRCFESVVEKSRCTVYVDSGSKDDSVQLAAEMSIDVVSLDMSIPFCAARARNTGYQRLLELNPDTQFVQFIDGDCELTSDWLPAAVDFLTTNSDVAIAAGLLRERFPETSIYNRLGDLEWNFAGTGDVDSVGGIFMVRREAFDAVGGFDATVPAGEEPELCQRLTRAGWRIVRLDREMAWHDLAMTRFGQWWRRMIRSGYGSMDVAARFGVAKFARNNRRVQVWTVWMALTLLLATIVTLNLETQMVRATALACGLLVCLWPAQFSRIAWRTWRKGSSGNVAIAYAFFMMIAFMPQIVGQYHYFVDRLCKRGFRLIEYKQHAKTR